MEAKSDCSDDRTFYECIGSRLKNTYPVRFNEPGVMDCSKEKCEDKENSHKKNEIDPAKEEPQFMDCSKECSFFSFPKMDSYNISKDPMIYFF